MIAVFDFKDTKITEKNEIKIEIERLLKLVNDELEKEVFILDKNIVFLGE